jgi:predicted nucleic acid-binding protein
MENRSFAFSEHLKKRMIERQIKKHWILQTIEHPGKSDIIAGDEIHFYKNNSKFDGKWLKVVVNPETKVIVTAYFDRKMLKKKQNEDHIR